MSRKQLSDLDFGGVARIRKVGERAIHGREPHLRAGAGKQQRRRLG